MKNIKYTDWSAFSKAHKEYRGGIKQIHNNGNGNAWFFKVGDTKPIEKHLFEKGKEDYENDPFWKPSENAFPKQF